jgi:hypothetical protein
MRTMSLRLLLCVGAMLLATSTTSQALISPDPVSSLLKTHADRIVNLKNVCAETLGAESLEYPPYSNDVFFLRYCLASADPKEQSSMLTNNLEWRTSGNGKSICDAATAALKEAAAAPGGWDNAPVLKAAPHSVLVSQYIKASNALTTTSSQNDLVYCIRAGQIDDTGLMSKVSIDQMVDFFLYAKEVNAQVANQRSLATDRLVCILTANDLAGVKLVGGSPDFRKALSVSSKRANDLYPSTYNGPTLLLNLPVILSALVQLFTPLFPPEVKARLKFVQGPLKKVDDLQLVATKAASGSERATFVQQLDDIVYRK